MTSDGNLSQQPDNLQQQPPPMKKKSNLVWKAISICLLIINVIFIFWAGGELGDPVQENLSGFVVLPLALPLVIIDFIAVFFYIRKQHRQGIANIIVYIVFTAISFILCFIGWIAVTVFFGPQLSTHLSSKELLFIEGLPFTTTIAIVAAVFMAILFFSLRPRK